MPRDSVIASIKKLTEEIGLTEGKAADLAAQMRAIMGYDISRTFDHDMAAAAAAITAPVLIIAVESDHVVIPTPAIEFARLLDSEPIILKNDCGHNAPQCAWDEIASAVRKFIWGGG